MKKYYILLSIVVIGAVSYFAYVSLFLQRVTVVNVDMQNISYKYANLSENDSVVFLKETSSDWYMHRKLSGTGEAEGMFPPGMPFGTYHLSVLNTQTGKHSAKSKSFVYDSVGKPIVTIDGNSLIASSRHPVISGSAKNISDIAILVEDKSSRRYFGGEVDLNGSIWSVTLSEAELPKGEYTVKIFNSRDDSQGVLASGKLVVN